MLLMTTVDDLPAEGLPYIIERVLAAGANNIHVLNAITKKGRIEYIIFVDVNRTQLDDISSLLALEFGTLGIKIIHAEHLALPYEVKSTKVRFKAGKVQSESEVRIKYLVQNKSELLSLKAEYEDIRTIALDLASKGIKISLSKLKSIIEAEAYKKMLHDSDVIVEVTDVNLEIE